MYKKIKSVVHNLITSERKKNLNYFKYKYPDPNKILSSEKKEFVNIVSKLWNENKCNPNVNGKVLVEGFLGAYGPNYLLRTGTISKAIEEVLGYEPIVLLKNYLELEVEKIKLYESFKLENFQSEKTYQPHFLIRIYIKVFTFWLYKSIKSSEGILHLSFRKLWFGDLLYDSVLKDSNGLVTILKDNDRIFANIEKAIHLIFTYSKLIKKNSIKLYIATHTQYLDYGLLVRLCIQKNIPVIESTDIQFWFHKSEILPDDIFKTKYHEYLRNDIRDFVEKNDMSHKVKELEIVLKDRFDGNFEQSDVQLAYKGKRIYSYEQLKKKLNINNSDPFVFIFAHVFADAPQGLSNGMLFRDYYIWLKETILTATEIEGINWIVKPHPSNKLYNEEGLVEEILKENKANNVFLCPNDLSPVCLKDIALAVVTAQGTVGIEYSCMGVPAVLASKPFYSGFGFTIEPESIDEYKLQLKNIHKVEKLSEHQKFRAKQVFAGFMNLQQTDTSIIDTDVLFAVWGGNDQKPSSDEAFRLVNKKLKGFDIKRYSLYINTVKLLKEQFLS